MQDLIMATKQSHIKTEKLEEKENLLEVNSSRNTLKFF